MIAFKQLLSSDVIVTPLEVNKAFTFSGSQLTQSTVGIDRFLGTLSTASFFIVRRQIVMDLLQIHLPSFSTISTSAVVWMAQAHTVGAEPS